MTMDKDGRTMSRREFAAVLGLVAGAPSSAFAQRARLTAGEVVERIKANLGAPWRGGPTDTFKSGDEDTPVTGIATTVMSTFDVIMRAAAAGKNMVITHEPTYWRANDAVQGFESDAVYQRKLQFIRDNNIVIWRFHDHLHARQPDMSAVGLADALGWTGYQSEDEPRVWALPRTRLRDLARDIEQRLGLKAIRVVGNPEITVSRAALMQGMAPFHAATIVPNVDVVVAGEQREWEGVEYVFDANTAGQQKGLILIGHWVSEDEGMRVCADWLKTFVSEVTVEWIPAGDPFWRP
ncbi:MAG TPA: Nif3-like dinuclear metal center hexameric protein [Vicinamibacterales bacterium]|nr:Nif3-like dinuclear metal center hexameric protein [Vicinamibacterales bacterium]